MSDSENMVRDLAILYGTLDPLRLAEATTLQSLNTASTNLTQAQNDRRDAEDALGIQNANIDRVQTQITELQNQLQALQGQITPLNNVVTAANQAVANKTEDVDRANTLHNQSLADIEAKIQEINALKARIKAEVDDDFPT